MRPARRTRTSPIATATLCVEGIAARRPRASLRHAALRLFAAPRCCARSPRYQRGSPAATTCVCYAMKANSTLAVLQMFARRGCGFDIVSGGELERVLAAGGDAGATSSSPASARRAPRCARALEAGIGCFNVESEAELERADARSRAAPAGARAVSLRVNPDVDAEDASLHLDRPARATSSASPTSDALRGVPARRARCRASRWPASTATSARRSPTARPYLDALDRLLDLVEASRRDGIPLRAHRLRRRPRHHLHATRRRPTPTRCRRSCSRASTRAATAIASSCSSPAARWSATPACCVTEVLYLKPGERARTSASSTPR